MSVSVIAGSECFERVEEIADLYVAQSVRVRRLVALSVSAPDAVVEDACQTAWMRLVRRRTAVRRESATRWLVRVATHEAVRAVRRDSRYVSLEQLAEEGADGPLRAPALLEELADHRARLDAIGRLPGRQQRLVWLQGLGFNYDEMAGEIGATRRTVERQLLRAKGTLAQAGP